MNKHNIIGSDSNIYDNFKPANNIIINTFINNTSINNINIKNINIKKEKECFKIYLDDIKKNYYKLLYDIENINNMLTDIEKYDNLNINNVYNIVDKHLFNLKSCLLNINISINTLSTNIKNNIINLNKTTDLLLVKHNHKNCCCLLI